jgi:hypothetical protein
MLRMFLLVFWGLTLAAQTQIDLRTQAKNIDFSAANATRPIKTGTVLPAACVARDMFFKTDAQAGENLYGCTAANTWSVQGGIPAGNCQYNATSQILTCMDSNDNVYTTVETATSGTPNQWIDYIAPTGIPHTSQPTAAAVGAVADPGSNGIPYRNGLGTAAPANASQMSGPFFCQDAGAGGGYACNVNPPISTYQTGTSYWFKAGAANTGAATINFNALGPKSIVKQYNQALAANDIQAGQWVTVTYDGTNMQMQSQTANAPQGAVSSVYGRAGAITAQGGDYSFSQLSGTANASQLPSVAMLTNQGNTVTAGTQDFSNAAHTLPMKSGTTATLPPLCTPGETYFAKDAPSGGNVYGCTAPNVWSAQGNLSVKSGGVTVGIRGTANFHRGRWVAEHGWRRRFRDQYPVGPGHGCGRDTAGRAEPRAVVRFKQRIRQSLHVCADSDAGRLYERHDAPLEARRGRRRRPNDAECRHVVGDAGGVVRWRDQSGVNDYFGGAILRHLVRRQRLPDRRRYIGWRRGKHDLSWRGSKQLHRICLGPIVHGGGCG